MMHMHNRCDHFCHIIARVIHGLSFVVAVLFFISAFRTAGLWGWGAGGYFESVIVLAIAAQATKGCGCCHNGCKSCHAGGGTEKDMDSGM